MEETISTPVETTTEQTPLESAENSQPVEKQTPENTEQEPANGADESAENVEEGKEQKEVIDWEQRAKDNQASFTRVSQEKAELAKRIEELESKLQPKTVTDGKINPEFERNYKMRLDNEEYLAYDNLARQLEPETRREVEKLLLEAKALYNPSNSYAYNAKLNQVKDYFRSDLVEAIATKKQELQGQIKNVFDKELAKDKQKRADMVAAEIGHVPELNELVSPESENYSEEVFGIVKAMFDYTGTVDVKATTNAINKIKELGVKEYLAKQKAETQKQNATVPNGETVLQKQTSTLPTAEEIRNTPGLYTKLVKQFKGDQKRVDAILMKG